jgi:hypothetical protein
MAKPYPTEPGYKALIAAIPSEDLEAAMRDKRFAASFEKFVSREEKKEQKRERREWLDRTAPLPSLEVSEDAARNEGHTDDVETFEGAVKAGEEEGPKLKKKAKRKSPKKQIVSGIEMPHVPRIKNSLDKPKEGRRQPSYMKSVPYPLVENPANRAAPFGYDDNDRPILPPSNPLPYTVVIRPQPEPECTNDRHNGTCAACQEAHRAENELREARERVARRAELSAQERRERERAAQRPHYSPPVEVKESKFICLRELLGISYDEILSWFPRVLRKKIEVPPYVPDKEGLQHKIDQARAQLKRIGGEWKQLSARVRGREFQKDGSPNPSYLDPDMRAELKRELKREMAKENKTISECRTEMYRTTAPLDPKAKVNELSWREEILRDRDFTFEDLFRHWYVVGDPNQRWTVVYKEAIASGLVGIWGRSRAENEVIQYAIQLRFCLPPSLEIQDKYPWIMRRFTDIFDDGYSAQEENDSAQENKLVLKTGGDQIGGQIVGAGVRCNTSTGVFTKRAHWDFDKPLDAPNLNVSWTGEHDGADSEASENPEEFQPD